MKNYLKLSTKLFLSISAFVLFVAFIEAPKEQNTDKTIARRGHHHGRHHRHGRGSGFYFRFNVGPGPRRYYREPYREPYYYNYSRVVCEVFDTEHEKVEEVQLAGRVLHLGRSNYGRRYYFSLRPGRYTIRWRVYNDRYMGSNYRSYSRSFRVLRDSREVYISIEGSRASIG